MGVFCRFLKKRRAESINMLIEGSVFLNLFYTLQ